MRVCLKKGLPFWQEEKVTRRRKKREITDLEGSMLVFGLFFDKKKKVEGEMKGKGRM